MSSKLKDLVNVATDLIDATFYVVQDDLDKQAPATLISDLIDAEVDPVETSLSDHLLDTANPHSVTKSQVGLSNVDNTSDVNKPISTATQTALDLKAPLASPTFTGTVSGITKSMVGLGNVDNTSDMNKPVSTAQQTAIDAAGGGMYRGNDGTVGTGNAGDIFRINAQTLTADVTIGATENASATGPVAVNTGVTLTVASGGTLAIV